jgi:hypothetical protein
MRNLTVFAVGRYRQAMVAYSEIICPLSTVVHFRAVCGGNVRIDGDRPRFQLPWLPKQSNPPLEDFIGHRPDLCIFPI